MRPGHCPRAVLAESPGKAQTSEGWDFRERGGQGNRQAGRAGRAPWVRPKFFPSTGDPKGCHCFSVLGLKCFFHMRKSPATLQQCRSVMSKELFLHQLPSRAGRPGGRAAWTPGPRATWPDHPPLSPGSQAAPSSPSSREKVWPRLAVGRGGFPTSPHLPRCHGSCQASRVVVRSRLWGSNGRQNGLTGRWMSLMGANSLESPKETGGKSEGDPTKARGAKHEQGGKLMGCQQGGRVGSRQGWPASWLGESRARQEPLPAPAGASRQERPPGGRCRHGAQSCSRWPGCLGGWRAEKSRREHRSRSARVSQGPGGWASSLSRNHRSLAITQSCLSIPGRTETESQG